MAPPNADRSPPRSASDGTVRIRVERIARVVAGVVEEEEHVRGLFTSLPDDKRAAEGGAEALLEIVRLRCCTIQRIRRGVERRRCRNSGSRRHRESDCRARLVRPRPNGPPGPAGARAASAEAAGRQPTAGPPRWTLTAGVARRDIAERLRCRGRTAPRNRQAVGAEESGGCLSVAERRDRSPADASIEKPGGSSGVSLSPGRGLGSALARRTGRRRSAGLWNGCRPAAAAAFGPPPADAPCTQAAGAPPLVPRPERPARRGSPRASSSDPTRCAHDVGSIGDVPRVSARRPPATAVGVNEPGDGAVATWAIPRQRPKGRRRRGCGLLRRAAASRRRRATAGWDAVTEPLTVQPEGACAPGMTGRSTAHVQTRPVLRNRSPRANSADRRPHGSIQDTRKRPDLRV